MGFLDTLGQAEVFERSQWFAPGRYIVEIRAVKMRQGGYNGDSIIIEGKVLGAASRAPEYPGPGDTAAQVIKISGDKQKEKMGRDNFMAFLTAAVGKRVSDLTDADWSQVAGEAIDDNALAGVVMYLECINKITKNGGDFTLHNWKGRATPDQIAELCD